MNYILEISKSSVVGDATAASAEKGKKIAEAMVDRLITLCSELSGKNV